MQGKIQEKKCWSFMPRILAQHEAHAAPENLLEIIS
jgi:hypothetical protein